MSVDLVKEAERIVSECAAPRKPEPKKKDVEFDALLNVVMALSCITLAVALILNLF